MKQGSRILRRAGFGTAVSALASLAIGVAPAGTAAAAGSDFEFQLVGTSQCLRPVNGINTQIGTAACNPADTAERWIASVFDPTAGMLFVSRSAGGPCMTVHNNLTVPAAPVEAEECDSSPNKFWHLIAASAPSDGSFLLENPASQLCVSTAFQFLSLDHCDLSSRAQRFLLNPV